MKTIPSTSTPLGIHPAHGATRYLLLCGAIAGPIYVLTAVIQVITREGFDIRHHSVSQLSNGYLGWIQVANFILAGVLVCAGSVGLRRATYPGRAGTWGPILLAVYGLGLIGAGIFVADPGYGFPPGTPDKAIAVSGNAFLHFVSATIGFFAFVSACLVFARRFVGLREYSWAGLSLLTSVLFLAAFLGVTTHSGNPSIVSAFYAAEILAWTWISAISLMLMKQPVRTEGHVGGVSPILVRAGSSNHPNVPGFGKLAH